MKTSRPLALINAISQLGAGRNACTVAWNERIDFLRRYLEAASVEVAEVVTIREPTNVDAGQTVLRHLESVALVCEQVRLAVDECLKQQVTPICIGGDHSIAIGSVSAAAQYLTSQNQELGLLWADAHMDMNTPTTTPSGNIHGMALAALCGQGHPKLTALGAKAPQINRARTVVLGLRFVDRAEMSNIDCNGPVLISMRDIDQSGLERALRDALPLVVTKTGGFHLSLDLDVIDPASAPGVNTPFPGGMTFREARMLCDKVASTGRMISMDIVEHNPDRNREETMLPVIGELIACAVGASMMP